MAKVAFTNWNCRVRPPRQKSSVNAIYTVLMGDCPRRWLLKQRATRRHTGWLASNFRALSILQWNRKVSWGEVSPQNFIVFYRILSTPLILPQRNPYAPWAHQEKTRSNSYSEINGSSDDYKHELNDANSAPLNKRVIVAIISAAVERTFPCYVKRHRMTRKTPRNNINAIISLFGAPGNELNLKKREP